MWLKLINLYIVEIAIILPLFMIVMFLQSILHLHSPLVTHLFISHRFSTCSSFTLLASNMHVVIVVLIHQDSGMLPTLGLMPPPDALQGYSYFSVFQCIIR